MCEAFSRCDCLLENRDFDHGTCFTDRVASCLAALAPYADASADGAIDIDNANADHCFNEMERRAQDCRSVLNDDSLPPACLSENLLTSTVGLDTLCPVDGIRCADGAGLCRDQVCVPLPVRNEPCTDDEGCAAQLECHADGTCDTPLGLGSSCRTGDRCPPGTSCRDGICIFGLAVGSGPCVVDNDCENGLVCSNGVCRNGPNDGDECGGQTCGGGNTCDRHYETRTCVARFGRGGACSTDDECQSRFCNGNGVCSDPPAVGALCLGGRCGDDGVCVEYVIDEDESDFVCDPRPVVAEPCIGGVCAVGARCDTGGQGTDDDVCVALPELDQRCAPGRVCADGLVCFNTPTNGSLCVEPRDEGATCAANTCAAGLYCDDVDRVCRPEFAVGESCDDNDQCDESGECGDLLQNVRCHDVPNIPGAECDGRCGGDQRCVGPEGVCAPALCSSP